MRFALVDRIVELEPGRRIVAVKNLTMAEEYLADHFPGFPVMPGVLMLQALTDAAAWLIRATDDFAQSIVVLREAASVRYGQFVSPGQKLTLSAEIQERQEGETRVKVRATMEGRLTVAARLVLAHYNLADRAPAAADRDEAVRRELRGEFALLWPQERFVGAPRA